MLDTVNTSRRSFLKAGERAGGGLFLSASLPSIARSMSCSLGLALAASSALALISWPAWQ